MVINEEETDTEIIDDEESFEKNQEELRRLFPDVGFEISIPLDELDDELSSLDKIFVELDTEYYDEDYEFETQPNFIVVIKLKNKTHITIRDVIQKLNDIKYTRYSDHRFLEMVYIRTDLVVNNEYPLNIFEMYFGS